MELVRRRTLPQGLLGQAIDYALKRWEALNRFVDDGVLEIDTETAEVLHLKYVADHIPESLHLTYAGTKVDYALAGIAGQNYLLPSRSELEMRGPTAWARNVIEFRDYRRFSVDSTVDFGPVK